MNNNDFTLDIIAGLNKQLSKAKLKWESREVIMSEMNKNRKYVRFYDAFYCGRDKGVV